MELRLWKSAAMIAFLSQSVFATALPALEQIQVPKCLANKMSSDYAVLAENKSFKILNVPSDELDGVRILADKVRCGAFVNVSSDFGTNKSLQKTAEQILAKPVVQPIASTETYSIQHQAEVDSAIATIVPNNIWATLTHLTNYHNRSAREDFGVQTAHWLKDQFSAMAQAAGRADVNTFFVNTRGYVQPSVVTVIGNNLPGKAVVIGAHMDTLGGRMPGAGDDGSGSSVVMEVARVLLNSPTLDHPVYIIWYSAEERGLVGSRHVVANFKKNNIQVKAAIQFDMSGYRYNNESTMWVYRDYVDTNLSNFVAELITHYVGVSVDYSKCGYGCSDHASWNAEGIPSAFPVESSFDNHNPHIHTSGDTMNLISLPHMTNFTKLGVALAIELAKD